MKNIYLVNFNGSEWNKWRIVVVPKYYLTKYDFITFPKILPTYPPIYLPTLLQKLLFKIFRKKKLVSYDSETHLMYSFTSILKLCISVSTKVRQDECMF